MSFTKQIFPLHIESNEEPDKYKTSWKQLIRISPLCYNVIV